MPPKRRRREASEVIQKNEEFESTSTKRRRNENISKSPDNSKKSDEESKPSEETVNGYISFEICKSCHTYKKRAEQLFNGLLTEIPSDKKLKLLINDGIKPRRGSFEVSYKATEKADEVLLWTGLKKGPPRKNKFPEVDRVLPELLKVFD